MPMNKSDRLDIVDVKAGIKAGRLSLIVKDEKWVLLADNETGEAVCLGEMKKKAYWKHSVKYRSESKTAEMFECSRCGRPYGREPGMRLLEECPECHSDMRGE